MLRSTCVPMVLSVSLAINVAHAAPPSPDVYPNSEFQKERFTWDEFYAENASERFEQNLNDCIAFDAADYGIGARCIQIPYNYCPETAPDDLKNPRGGDAFMACISHLTHFWEKRLQAAHSDLVLHYESVDRKKPEAQHRAPQLIATQSIWRDWRQAKCDFLVEGQNHYPWIGVSYETGRYNLTAIRALELEDLYVMSR